MPKYPQLPRSRAGQDQGGPRWDTLTKKSKSTKLLHIVLCYTQGVVAYDSVLFGGCIAPPLTPLQVKPEALILIVLATAKTFNSDFCRQVSNAL